MLLQIRQYHFDGFLKLWIVAGTHGGGVVLHFNIRRHAVVLHVPLTSRAVKRQVGSGDETAIHQLRKAEDSYEASPRALADDGADVLLAEHPGQSIPARAGEFIDDHDLGTKDRILRSGEI